MRFSFKNTFKGLNLEKMKGEGGDLLLTIQAMVEEEEGMAMMVGKVQSTPTKTTSTNQNSKVQRRE